MRAKGKNLWSVVLPGFFAGPPNNRAKHLAQNSWCAGVDNMAMRSKIPLCLAITLGVCLSVITTEAIPNEV